MEKNKEKTKITVGLVASWFFGIIFMGSGIGIVGEGFYFSGVIIILCSAMIIPYFNRLVSNKFNVELSSGIKIVLVIVILTFMAIAMSQTNTSTKINKDQSNNIPLVTGESSEVKESVIETTQSKPTLNKKTEYVKNYVKLENVQVGKGYGQFDVPGYSPEKTTVEGKIRNTGKEILDTVKITVYFLDSENVRIGEKEYYPISAYSLLGDKTPLKPNYVRDWGYVVEDAPSGWAKKVEVVINDITFLEE